MERLLHHIFRELLRDFEVALVGPAGSAEHAGNARFVAECHLSPTWRFLAQCQWRAYRGARQLRPDLVIAGSGVTTPAALIAGRAVDAPVLAYLHGLDIVAKSWLYQNLFVPAIKRCDALAVNSRNTAELAYRVGAKNDRVSILPPGVSMPSPPSDAGCSAFRARVGHSEGPILLSVGRLTARKGLTEFVRNAVPRLASKHPHLRLVIIGSEPEQALNKSTSERARIEEVLLEVGLARHVVFLGSVSDEVVNAAYTISDLLVFPVLDQPGDVEGFGMVAIEAAAHGLPTVAFAVGGVPDAVKPGVSGYLVEPGNYAHFAETILEHLSSEDRSTWFKGCVRFAEEFSWVRFGTQLRRICRETIEQSRER